MEPSVLILDEPTAGLDPAGAAGILANLEEYHREKNATIILVSHSMEDVARSADRLVVVDNGTLPITGTPREVFSQGGRLEEMGLGLPAVTRIFHRLKQLGADVDHSVFTVEQARDTILAKLGRRDV